MLHAYKYILENSPKNAFMVIESIANAVYKAIKNPEFYNPEKYKINNDGSYRAFEKHYFRISYRFTKNVIRVLKVKNTKMNPRNY